MPVRLGEVAERLGAKLIGDPDREIVGLATLEVASPEEISFLTSSRYAEAAGRSRAGALLVGPDHPEFPHDLLVVAEPYVALAELIDLLLPPEERAAGIHPTAVLDDGVEVEEGVSIGALCTIGAGSSLGREVRLHPGVTVGRGCRIGASTEIHPRAVLYDGVTVGERCILHAGCVIGSDGFRFATTAEGRHRKLRHTGTVVIEDDVEIGANTTIDRGLLDETHVGAGTKIDNLVQIAHNVRIGEGSLLIAQTGIAGSTRLGRQVVMAGQSGVIGHLELGDGVRVAAKSAVFQSVPAGRQVAGSPAVEAAAWRRQQAWLKRLDELGKRLRRLERSVGGDGEDGKP